MWIIFLIQQYLMIHFILFLSDICVLPNIKKICGREGLPLLCLLITPTLYIRTIHIVINIPIILVELNFLFRLRQRPESKKGIFYNNDCYSK